MTENSGGQRILVVDDDKNMRLALRETLIREGYRVDLAEDGSQAASLFKEEDLALIVTDVKMPVMGGMDLLRSVKRDRPEVPVVVMTGYGTIGNAVEAMKAGATDYIVKPFSSDDLLEIVNRNASRSLDVDELCTIPGAPPEKAAIVTSDFRMIKMIRIARNVAASDATILIEGESGTGKELLAYYIHRTSPRASAPFVAVNCAAVPEHLLESELFGHEKGAFTGALAQKKGKFELANCGTVLLDEIGEMEPILQAKLLRVLQEREIDRVGRGMPIPVDIRIIATTNVDLEKMVASGKFREDLFYRLNVIPLTIPPLRERPGDIVPLAETFLKRVAMKNSKGSLHLSQEAADLLKTHDWPGNVRELQNTIERAVLLTDGEIIGPDSLFVSDRDQPVPSGAGVCVGVSLKEMERSLILDTLKDCNGNRTRAADILGISIRTLRNKLNEYRGEGFLADGK